MRHSVAGVHIKASVFVLGVLAAVVAGGATALLVGDAAGFVVAGALLLATLAALFAPPLVLRGLLAATSLVLVVGLAIGVWAAATVLGALGDTSGPVAAADASALSAADTKIDDIEEASAFRLELTEDELRAYTLDALRDERNNPIADVRFDVRAGHTDNGGELAFEAELKRGGTTAEGAVSATLVNGAVNIEILDIGLGAFQLPRLAKGTIEDLVERISDFNDVLSQRRADVQAITFTDDTVIIVGTQAGGRLLTEESFLSGFAAQATSLIDVAAIPPERYGPGIVDGISGGDPPFYVALGDSLAANVGVDRARDGYVSRFHRQLELRDGDNYGLRNFGVIGETTGTMIRTGQLAEAVAFLEANDVAYVTINVGANNLLGHLGTTDCSRSLDAPACRERIADAFAGYPDDLAVIFAEVAEAAPDGTIVFLTAYNPFNLGFGSPIEAEMDRALGEFNALAVTVALEHGFLVADGFAALDGTAAVTTHMLDAVPDIHPLPIGYDRLTGALLDALP